MEQHYMYYVSAVDSYERLSRILYADVISDKVNGIIPKDSESNQSVQRIFFAAL